MVHPILLQSMKPSRNVYPFTLLIWHSSDVATVGFLLLGITSVRASVAYGSINNFDTVNDTGVECHGFEIEIDDIHSADITYTYSWNHYGTPKISEDNADPLHPKVRVRYESARNPNGTWAAYTAIPSGPIAPTQGHQFTDPSVNFGGEHLGAGYRGTPSSVSYHWLIDSGGALALGPAVNIATPTFTYNPPAAAVPAQVQAAIVPPPPPVPDPLEFGSASWVKEIRTSTHNNNEVKLRDLVSEDPANPNDKNLRNGEPDEVEVEWQILQVDHNAANGGANGELVGAPENLNHGDEVITRRYEFYKYAGPLDAETGEALGASVGSDGIHGVGAYTNTVVVGDFFGSQMSAFDNELQVGLIDHLPDGNINAIYATRALVIAVVPFTAASTGILPTGLTFNEATGELSGMPTVSGVFTFNVRLVATNSPALMKTYTFAIAAAGEELPPHSTVDTVASPLTGGFTTGNGFYTNNTTATVTATPVAGFAFVNWTDNGKAISSSASYTFTNLVNRSLVANFVSIPSLSLYLTSPSSLVLAWPTKDANLVLQLSTNLGITNWVSAPEPVTIVGTNNRVSISPIVGDRFYRLIRP